MKLDGLKVIALVAVAILPPWIAANHHQKLSDSQERRFAAGVVNQLREASSVQEDFLVTSGRFVSAEEMDAAVKYPLTSFLAAGGGLGNRMPAVLTVEVVSDSTVIIRGRMLHAPWVQCSNRVSGPEREGDHAYRCSTDGLVAAAGMTGSLGIPVAVASLLLSLLLGRRWEGSDATQLATLALAASLLLLFLLSGGPIELIPSFDTPGSVLGDSTWSVWMVAR